MAALQSTRAKASDASVPVSVPSRVLIRRSRPAPGSTGRIPFSRLDHPGGRAPRCAAAGAAGAGDDPRRVLPYFTITDTGVVKSLRSRARTIAARNQYTPGA